eukprot:NODE_7507_length_761_cov_95.601881_g7263_i0.p1 GENE.NODE_7507_length_761_cov_95.601881_g7263_i0~~NODE_7507_length_761_cov_95.601881_g7263_i0.p1  ORF type:complete len:151 (-),score=37.52 NODE_7507_length_761_cov_95.601881_g7263_i0:244-696(-)
MSSTSTQSIVEILSELELQFHKTEADFKRISHNYDAAFLEKLGPTGLSSTSHPANLLKRMRALAAKTKKIQPKVETLAAGRQTLMGAVGQLTQTRAFLQHTDQLLLKKDERGMYQIEEDGAPQFTNLSTTTTAAKTSLHQFNEKLEATKA